MVGMIGGEDLFEQHLVNAAVRTIFALTLFVLDDTALDVEFLLGYGAEQVAHAVGLHPQRHIHRGARYGFEIVGAIKPRGAIGVGGTGQFEWFVVSAFVVFGAGEFQVLEQVCEAGLAGRLVSRTDMEPEADGDDRRLVVFADDQGQAVRQHGFGERNID